MTMKRLLFLLSILIVLQNDALRAQPPMGKGPMGQGPMGNGQMGMHGRMMGTLPEAMSSDTNPISTAKADLGRMLFYDPRLSKDGTVSCNSCHSLTNYGVDGKRVSTGFQGQQGTRNSPTVYNAAGQLAQFWDGRALNVEEQAKGPVLNPVEMAMASENDVVTTLRAIAGYEGPFRRAFPGEAQPITFNNMAKAIGVFERKLVTPSPWDRFLQGDRNAITAEQMGGHHQFMQSGCATCHNGPYVGGSMFQKLGADKPWPVVTDLGRIEVTKSAADRMVFKVPTLRNVAKTGPYFHDGRTSSLDEAVRLMGEHQLGLKLDEQQIRQIVAWLGTLTGEIPMDYIKAPVLPN
jgi:cytochrome c peroxidase